MVQETEGQRVYTNLKALSPASAQASGESQVSVHLSVQEVGGRSFHLTGTHPAQCVRPLCEVLSGTNRSEMSMGFLGLWLLSRSFLVFLG